MKQNYTVQKIDRRDAEPYILGIHYAKRWPSISYCFGLFRDGEMCGVVSYGTPPSPTLRRGVCGDEYAGNVLELNRLVLAQNRKNEASMLVARSLKLLPPKSVVISFADTEQHHLGIVYQAANFLYCGLSAKRTDWKVRGKEHLHGQTISDEFRGVPNRSAAMREKYGDDFYLEPRPRKHRYVYFAGCQKFRKAARNALMYKQEPYPKKQT